MTDTTAEIERKAERHARRQADRARTIARAKERSPYPDEEHEYGCSCWECITFASDAPEHGFVSFSSVLVGIVLLVLIAGALRFALDALSAAGGAL